MIKIMMFISSYAPLYLMMLILYYDYYKDIFQKFEYGKLILILSLVFFLLISFLSLYLLKKSSGSDVEEIKNIEKPNDTIISYIMTYIVPLLSINLDDQNIYSKIITNVLLFSIIGILYVRLDLIYLNPLWSIFKYYSYEFNNDKILITNIPYSSLRKMEDIKGFHVLNLIFIAHEKDNKRE